MKLTDENLQQFTDLVNATIRELVAADHHANDDELEQCCDVIAQVQNNVEALVEILDESAPLIAEKAFTCEKCNDTGVIVYGAGDRKLDCECQESPIKSINDQQKAAS